MSNQSTTSSLCFYHPTKDSSTTCFRCNKPICDNDKMLYDDNTYDYGMIRDACIPCFAVLTEKDSEGKFSLFVAYFFLAIWIIVTTIIFWPLLIISFLIYYFIHNQRKQKVKAAEDSKIKFNQFLDTLEPEKMKTVSNIYTISCFKCDNLLDPSDIYCRVCGDPMDEE